MSGQLLVLLMPMVLQVLYRVMPRAKALWVVSLRLLLLMLRVAVAEVALLVVLLFISVVRALRAMLRSTVSLVLMMLMTLPVVLMWVRVWAVGGLCSGVGSLCSRVGAPWAVTLAGAVGSDRESAPEVVWVDGDANGEGVAGDAQGDVVGEGSVGGAGGGDSVGAAGDGLVDGIRARLWWQGCC